MKAFSNSFQVLVVAGGNERIHSFASPFSEKEIILASQYQVPSDLVQSKYWQNYSDDQDSLLSSYRQIVS